MYCYGIERDFFKILFNQQYPRWQKSELSQSITIYIHMQNHRLKELTKICVIIIKAKKKKIYLLKKSFDIKHSHCSHKLEYTTYFHSMHKIG